MAQRGTHPGDVGGIGTRATRRVSSPTVVNLWDRGRRIVSPWHDCSVVVMMLLNDLEFVVTCQEV